MISFTRLSGAAKPRQEVRYSGMMCALDGCANTTRERKPYCTAHVEHHAYVRGLLSSVKGREEEEARVRRLGTRGVDSGGLNAREILQQLRVHGDRTAERLALAIRIDLELMQVYLSALARRKLVRLGRSDRGSTVVSLRNSDSEAWAQRKGRAKTPARRTTPRSA